MHITNSVFINDDESGLHHDYDAWLVKMAPHEPVRQYRRNDTGEDDAKAEVAGARGRAGGNRWPLRLQQVGADLLWGVRRMQKEESAREDKRGIATASP